MNKVLDMPEGEEREKARMVLSEERRKNLDATVLVSTAYRKLLEDKPWDSDGGGVVEEELS